MLFFRASIFALAGAVLAIGGTALFLIIEDTLHPLPAAYAVEPDSFRQARNRGVMVSLNHGFPARVHWTLFVDFLRERYSATGTENGTEPIQNWSCPVIDFHINATGV